MCAIGRGLMAKPDLLLLDEPSLGLAPLMVQEIFSLVAELRAAGMAVLLVEQHVKQALSIADRGLVLQNGRIALAGKGPNCVNDSVLKRAYMGHQH